ncbi:hypothetical protein FRC04_006503 [Tulasnella sp. 424]|nr:hypothetical protein FRC04_006503 [Tulasnella sp. 424]KAG8981037.1 hypothetical protein FRC05_003937 [Tulasnella sp. 425]
MSPKSTSAPSGVLETIQVPAATKNATLTASTTANAALDAKDNRSSLRSRKVVMKPHDRTKARTGRGHDKYSKTDNERIRRKRQHGSARGVFDDDDVDAAATAEAMENSALEYSVKDVENPMLSIFSGPRTPLEVVEVPLLTIIQTSKPWDGVGADYELVSNPGDVIALDDDMDYTDDEWEAVDDMNKPAKPIRKSYAAALQVGIKA